MVILKIIGAILTISSSAAMGYYFSSNLKDRIDDMKELKKNILILRGDIRYGCTPLPEAIMTIAGRQQGNFSEFFGVISERLNQLDGIPFYEIWKMAVSEQLQKTALTKSDKEYLGRLGENLGYLDKEMQINTIDLYIEQLENETENASKSMKDKARLYNTLGVMAGIFITIVMI